MKEDDEEKQVDDLKHSDTVTSHDNIALASDIATDKGSSGLTALNQESPVHRKRGTGNLLSFFVVVMLLLVAAAAIWYFDFRHPGKSANTNPKVSLLSGINNVSQLKTAKAKLSQTVKPVSSSAKQLQVLE
jgi:hypothetical protein